jgi:mono/diheme cytochrome c family protein
MTAPSASGATVGFAATLLAATLARSAIASPEQDYTLYCMGCHGPTAQGVPGKIPPLAGALARFMRTSDGRNYVLRVPGAANSVLTDAQLAAVLNWLAERYRSPDDPRPEPFTVQEVTAVRRTPLADVHARRSEVVRALAASGAAPAGSY